MLTKRSAGWSLMLFGACAAYGFGCGSDSSGGGGTGDGGVTGAGGAGGSLATSTTGTQASTTTGTTTGTGGAGGGGATNLGKACKANADCGGEFVCLKSSDTIIDGAGVPNGLCTIDCTLVDKCSAYGGICVTVTADADGGNNKDYCFEGCAIGPATGTPPPKCHSRPDVACEPVNAMETIFACIPICVTDSDCGGRKCDMGTGLCRDAVTPGTAIGGGCTSTRGMANTECAGGLCIPIETVDSGSTPGVCSAFCRLGTAEACGLRTGALDAGASVGACVLPWDTGYNTGDLGLCLQLCDGPGDCSLKHPQWTCRTDLTVRVIGHSICFPPDPG